MATSMVFHEVEDGLPWAHAWKKGPGSRHEMFAKIGVTARTFADQSNPDSMGLILEVPDMALFKSFMESDEARTAMREDRLKVETMHVLSELAP